MSNLAAINADNTDLHQLIKNWFVEHNKISADSFSSTLSLLKEQDSNRGLPQLLIKLGQVSADDLALSLSEILDLQLISIDECPTNPICEEQLSANFLKENAIQPIHFVDDTLTLAMVDPSDQYAVDSVRLATNADKVIRVVISKSDLDSLHDQFFSDGKSQLGQILDQVESQDEPGETDVEQLRDMASEAPVIRLVNLLIQRACKKNASDIHIEPFNEKLKIRYRCDGLLQEIESPPAHMSPAVISRIKIMAHMNIAERRLPQDGRIDLKVQGQNIDIRVSTVPTVHGESVVMRLLRRDSLVLDFNSLGISGQQLEHLNNALAQPNGMILVTGPTGSGKSTTLYTALNGLNTEERKIITVEDPVEYQLEGVNQIQVKSSIGLSFASALRSIVRQDPDVIMVGEMRDLEAAKICIQSALTGHLVLSTLHTNEAAGSITRLLEMGVEDYLLTSTLLCIVGQRLVRRLCHHCAEPYQPLPELLNTICQRAGLTPDTSMRLYHPKGCEHCNGSGFRGRIAIVETLPMNDAIRQKMMQKTDAQQLQTTAIEQGMITMYADGCHKALSGQTTFEEILRVTQEG